MHLGSFMVSILIHVLPVMYLPMTLQSFAQSVYFSWINFIYNAVIFCFILAHSTFFLLFLTFNVLVICIVAVHFLLARVDNV